MTTKVMKEKFQYLACAFISKKTFKNQTNDFQV